MLEQYTSKSATLVAAAMESAGAALQADMLDWVNGAAGQSLAGLFFLVAMMTAVIAFASGGNYKWARYLLVGPPLFFFLTQVRIASSGSEWQFADRRYPKEAVDQVLRGVGDYENGERGGSDVALFFQMWNLMVSEIVNHMIGLLNLTESDSDHNFISKVERYMYSQIKTHFPEYNLRVFVHLALSNQCGYYYMLKKDLEDLHVAQLRKEQIKAVLDKIKDRKVFEVWRPANQEENELMWFLTEHAGIGPKEEKKSEMFTCDELWTAAVRAARPIAYAEVLKHVDINRMPQQSADTVLGTLLQMAKGMVNRASGLLKATEGDAMRKAVDARIARALFREIYEMNPWSKYVGMEMHSGMYSTGFGHGLHGEGEQEANISNSIQQFNQTEKYQYKGDFVNGALSMPYFQGVLLLMLSVSYPFFAMMVVIPNRAGAFFYWMGLWVWAKSWDFGFGVVMMIDNMLYAMFPRGPGLNDGDIDNPGLAWARIFEIDPNYSATTYYNLIAVCLYAVPLATGALIKKGAGELQNIVRGGWTSYSTRLAGSLATSARSAQAQTYAMHNQMRKFEAGLSGFFEGLFSKDVQQHMQGLVGTYAAGAGSQAAQDFIRTNFDLDPNNKNQKADYAKVHGEYMKVMRDYHKSNIQAKIRLHVAMRQYQASTDSFSSFMSESAAATKFYNHDFADSYPMDAILGAYIAENYIDRDQLMSGAGDAAIDTLLKSDNGYTLNPKQFPVVQDVLGIGNKAKGALFPGGGARGR